MTPPPSRQAIYKIRKNFGQTGSVNNSSNRGSPITVTSPENRMQVGRIFGIIVHKDDAENSLKKSWLVCFICI